MLAWIAALRDAILDCTFVPGMALSQQSARLHRGRIADAIFVRQATGCRAAELTDKAPQARRRELACIVHRAAPGARAGSRRLHRALATNEEFHHRG